MSRTKTSNAEDRNVVATKVNDRIHAQLKLLSGATGTPASVLIVHAIARYIEVEMPKHKNEIMSYLSGDSLEVNGEVVQAAE